MRRAAPPGAALPSPVEIRVTTPEGNVVDVLREKGEDMYGQFALNPAVAKIDENAARW